MTAARPLTGRRVALIAGLIFAVVLTANIMLIVFSVRSFSGLVVPNSYVASQDFDRRRAAQQALGWTLHLTHDGQRIELSFTDISGRPVRPAELDVRVGYPSTDRTDRDVPLEPAGTGYAAHLPLEPGNWLVQIRAVAADGTAYSRDEPLRLVPPA